MPTIGYTPKKLLVSCNIWTKPAFKALGKPFNKLSDVRDFAVKQGYSGIKITTKD